MARIRTDQPVLPSLLDRLIDDEPQQILSSVKGFSILLKEIKANIRRDLENLLNTRIYRQNDIDELNELEQSLVNYGLPDFSRVQYSSEEHRERFRAVVQQAIKKFEPRLQRVRVDISPAGEEYERTLYLKISAVLMVEPNPVPLIFDSRVHTLDRAVKLRELQHG